MKVLSQIEWVWAALKPISQKICEIIWDWTLDMCVDVTSNFRHRICTTVGPGGSKARGSKARSYKSRSSKTRNNQSSLAITLQTNLGIS